MPYNSEFIRVTWGYSIFGTDEIANTSLSLKPTVTNFVAARSTLDLIAASVTLQALVKTRMATLMGHANLRWADYSRLNTVRFAAIDTAGLEIGAATILSSVAVAGTTANTVLPQSTVVHTLRSGLTTGAANFGRMYLPHTRVSQASGQPGTDTTTAQECANQFRTFLNGLHSDLDAALPVDLRAHIMNKDAFSPVNKLVTQVSVGVLNDTQRRRRNRLGETPQFAVIP